MRLLCVPPLRSPNLKKESGKFKLNRGFLYQLQSCIESNRRILRRLNLRDVNDYDECNDLDRQKIRFTLISIYTLRPSLLTAPVLFGPLYPASPPSFSTLYMRQQERLSPTMGYFPGSISLIMPAAIMNIILLTWSYLERETGN